MQYSRCLTKRHKDAYGGSNIASPYQELQQQQTYTVTNAANAPADTKIRLEFANIDNPMGQLALAETVGLIIIMANHITMLNGEEEGSRFSYKSGNSVAVIVGVVIVTVVM